MREGQDVLSSSGGGGGEHYSYKIRQLANENGVLLDQSQYM